MNEDKARNAVFMLMQNDVIQYCHMLASVNKNPSKTEYTPSSIYTVYTIEICSLCHKLCGISGRHHLGISCRSVICWETASDCERLYQGPKTTTQLNDQSAVSSEAFKFIFLNTVFIFYLPVLMFLQCHAII